MLTAGNRPNIGHPEPFLFISLVYFPCIRSLAAIAPPAVQESDRRRAPSGRQSRPHSCSRVRPGKPSIGKSEPIMDVLTRHFQEDVPWCLLIAQDIFKRMYLGLQALRTYFILPILFIACEETACRLF
ncbi:hypothetical protein IEQ34_021734 [Dendrobium chrysotoxum]|uniref:Uncharacterized protein n=1 Tax=Dendrobium chrysotoxum TaxID=161865 RepID=A0AAV7G5K2_DENCH|nr:hypothetical protein IEQ34_021734 [Dendrobium chrysotoxum]